MDQETDIPEDKDEVDHRCGWLCLKPVCMLRCGTPPCLLASLCAFFIVNQAVISGVWSPSISTIEKRFSLSSSQSGLITSIYDVAVLLFAGPVSYFGIRNRPRWLGGGMLIMGLGYFLFILPHMIIEKYEPAGGTAFPGNSSASHLCTSSAGLPTKCTTASSGTNLYYGIFLIAMFVAGIGGTSMLALGIPFIDDSVHPNKSPMFVGIFSASGIIGVVIGFTMTSFCLQLFVNPSVAVTITPKDFGQWIGAWWLGFVIGIILAIIVGIWLLAFPTELRNAKEVRKQLEKERTEQKREEAPTLTLKELPKILKELLVDNPTYVFIVIFSSLEFFQVSAITLFLPKMMSVQFRESPIKVSLIFGIVGVIAATVGTIGGSYIQQRLKLGCIGALKFTAIVSFIAMCLEGYLFIYCDSDLVAGVNTAYVNGSQCNLNCSCTQALFNPVCADALTYATPCLAGCTKGMGPRMFLNCTCASPDSTAALGACPASCGSLSYVYYTTFFIATCVLCLYITPVTMAVLRCVPFRLKTFAVGIQSILIRLLGTIPGPIFVGYLIDNSCLFWNRTCDGQRGSCGLYDNKKMAISVAMSSIVVKALGTLSMFIAWQIYKRKGINEEEITTSSSDLREINS